MNGNDLQPRHHRSVWGSHLPQPIQRARRLGRELWQQRTVTLLFGVSLLFVVIRTALLSVPEFFPSGARIGEVLFELAIAYIGAWVFNLLVVILPRLHDRDAVMKAAGQVILRLATIGLRMRRDLGLPAEPGKGDTKMDTSASELTEKLKTLSLTDEAPLVMPKGTTIRFASWQEWVVDKIREVDAFNASLVPYLPFLETELIYRLNDVVLSKFIVMGRHMTGIAFRGGMNIFSGTLPEFLIACETLRVYIERNPSLSP